MFSDRKPKFRSRKLEFHRGLEVYRFDEIDDIEEFDEPLRSVTQVATGVDKEEEDEHHLKQALNRQNNRAQPYYIPTPETSQQVPDYNHFYPDNFKMIKTYIKSATSLNEDPMANFPKYCCDELDRKFIASLSERREIPSGFDLTLYEKIIDCLEDAAHKFSENIVGHECIERLRDKHSSVLPQESVINKIIEHWKNRRINEKKITPFLKHEDLGKIGADPYVCFRRRELKIPRKTRRSDAQITDRLRKLHLDFSSMKLLLEAAIKRDKFKKDALVLEGELFEKYRLVDQWRRHHNSEWPSHLPTFKSAAQSILEFKKKKSRFEDGDLIDTTAAGYKIAIPVAALRGSRHYKPYVPHDVGRLIHRDLNTIFGHHHHNHEGPEAEKAVEDILDDQGLGLVGQEFQPFEYFDGRPMSCRRGRGGRVIFDRPRKRGIAVDTSLMDMSIDEVNKFHFQILNAKEFTQVQVQVGNYNVHAVQTANQIIQPMSYQAWVTATAPILQALTGTTKIKSPKKKRARTTEAMVEDLSSGGAETNMSGEITKLGGNSQITVKVKSQPKESQRKGTGARFTPHGLAPDTIEAATM